jgi:hypothetical protein
MLKLSRSPIAVSQQEQLLVMLPSLFDHGRDSCIGSLGPKAMSGGVIGVGNSEHEVVGLSISRAAVSHSELYLSREDFDSGKRIQD